MGLGTETGTKAGLGRVEERRRVARKCTYVVDAMWETGETWVEREKNVEKKGLVQQLPTQIIYRKARKQRGDHKVPGA